MYVCTKVSSRSWFTTCRHSRTYHIWVHYVLAADARLRTSIWEVLFFSGTVNASARLACPWRRHPDRTSASAFSTHRSCVLCPIHYNRFLLPSAQLFLSTKFPSVHTHTQNNQRYASCLINVMHITSHLHALLEGILCCNSHCRHLNQIELGI